MRAKYYFEALGTYFEVYDKNGNDGRESYNRFDTVGI
jgi:hypothetical protein